MSEAIKVRIYQGDDDVREFEIKGIDRPKVSFEEHKVLNPEGVGYVTSSLSHDPLVMRGAGELAQAIIEGGNRIVLEIRHPEYPKYKATFDNVHVLSDSDVKNGNISIVYSGVHLHDLLNQI